MSEEHKRPWWHFDSKYVALGMIIFLVLSFVLYGCAPATPFTTGAEVQPPVGCIEYRQRGGEC